MPSRCSWWCFLPTAISQAITYLLVFQNTIGTHKTLSTVSRLCKLAGIVGYYTNHSLCTTVTSRLYQSGVDEQLMMERTGHQSIEGVRSYKRTSDQQREALSNLLNHECPAGPSTAIIPEQLLRDQPILNQSLLSSSHTQTSQLRFAVNLPSANCTVNFYIGSTSDLKRKRRAIVISDSDDSQ